MATKPKRRRIMMRITKGAVLLIIVAAYAVMAMVIGVLFANVILMVSAA